MTLSLKCSLHWEPRWRADLWQPCTSQWWAPPRLSLSSWRLLSCSWRSASPFFARSRLETRIVVTGGRLATAFGVVRFETCPWATYNFFVWPNFACSRHLGFSNALGPRPPLRWSWISGATVAIKSEIVYHRHFPTEIDCTATLQKISLSRVTATLEISLHGR